jgi:hypothetical protein
MVRQKLSQKQRRGEVKNNRIKKVERGNDCCLSWKKWLRRLK